MFPMVSLVSKYGAPNTAELPPRNLDGLSGLFPRSIFQQQLRVLKKHLTSLSTLVSEARQKH